MSGAASLGLHMGICGSLAAASGGRKAGATRGWGWRGGGQKERLQLLRLIGRHGAGLLLLLVVASAALLCSLFAIIKENGKEVYFYRISNEGSCCNSCCVAAACAKMLVDQEEREMELLMASIIETQLRKIQYKSKYYEELELIMDQEYATIQQIKESLLKEWLSEKDPVQDQTL